MAFVNREKTVELGDEIYEAPCIVIEHSDVAAGHICDVNVLALVDQPDKSATHADYIVVGMGTENQHGARFRSGRLGGYRSHHFVEDQASQPLSRPAFPEQLI